MEDTTQVSQRDGGRTHGRVTCDACDGSMVCRISAQQRAGRLLISFSATSNYLSAHHHPRYIYIAMSLRKSFSGFRKKAKDRLSKIGGRTEEIRVNAGGDGLYHPASSSQSEPAIVVEDGFKGDPEADEGVSNPRPGGSLSVSQSTVERGHSQGKNDDEVDGGGAGQKALYPHSYMQAESGSSREKRTVGGKQTERADLPRSDVERETTPAPSIFRAGESESM